MYSGRVEHAVAAPVESGAPRYICMYTCISIRIYMYMYM